MSILNRIREEAEKSSGNWGKFFYLKAGQRKRIRILSDMEDAIEITVHKNFKEQIDVPCQELFGRPCKYCEDPEISTRAEFIWSVWDYDANEVKLMKYAMNNCSPVGQIAEAYENYGTITDRDYTISVRGESKDRTFSLLPVGEKSKMRNPKAKPYTKKEILKMLDAAYPDKKGNYKKSGDTYTREDDADDMDGFMNRPEPIDYSEMTPQQLYKLCGEKGIEAEPKMKQKYYINLLQEYDEQNLSDDGWGEEETEEGKPDYSSMTAKELYKLCHERGIDAQQRKPEKYYIRLLEDDDKAKEEWGGDDSDEWEEELPFN